MAIPICSGNSVVSISSLSRLFVAGTNTGQRVPIGRWNPASSGIWLAGLKPSRISYGSFVANSSSFDLSALGLSSREAHATDAAHLLLLEQTYLTLHSVHHTRKSLVGVYFGIAVGMMQILDAASDKEPVASVYAATSTMAAHLTIPNAVRARPEYAVVKRKRAPNTGRHHVPASEN